MFSLDTPHITVWTHTTHMGPAVIRLPYHHASPGCQISHDGKMAFTNVKVCQLRRVWLLTLPYDLQCLEPENQGRMWPFSSWLLILCKAHTHTGTSLTELKTPVFCPSRPPCPPQAAALSAPSSYSLSECLMSPSAARLSGKLLFCRPPQS